MELTKSLEKLLLLENSTRGVGFIDNPSKISSTMTRMSVYATAIEEKLAELEQEYEEKQGQLYKQLLIEENLSATAAEKHVKIEMNELRGQIAYLTRIVASGWKQIGVLQSRINHLVKLSETTNI